MITLALFLRRFLPRSLKRIELTIKDHLLVTITVGALSALIGLILFIQLAFTVILIPVSIAGFALMLLMVTVGWVAIGGILASAVQVHLPVHVPQNLVYILGVSMISIIIDAIGYLPILGAPVVLLSASIGIGSALLTRFGFQLYTPAPDQELL